MNGPIVTRKQKTENLEIPVVTICPNFAFKPSINQQFDFPTRDLFIYSQGTNQNLQSIFHGQTVLDVFKNFSYANDFSFRFMNNINKLEFNLNPGVNMMQRGHVSVNSVLKFEGSGVTYFIFFLISFGYFFRCYDFG